MCSRFLHSMTYQRTAVFEVHSRFGHKCCHVWKMKRVRSAAFNRTLRRLGDSCLMAGGRETMISFPSADLSREKGLVEGSPGEHSFEGPMWIGLIEELLESVQTCLETPDINHSSQLPPPEERGPAAPGEVLDEGSSSSLSLQERPDAINQRADTLQPPKRLSSGLGSGTGEAAFSAKLAAVSRPVDMSQDRHFASFEDYHENRRLPVLSSLRGLNAR